MASTLGPEGETLRVKGGHATRPRLLARAAGRQAGSQPLANFKGRTPRPRAPPRGGITPCNALSSTPTRLLIGNLRGRVERGVRGACWVGQGLSRFRVLGFAQLSKELTPMGVHTSHLYLSPPPSSLPSPPPRYLPSLAEQLGARLSASPVSREPQPSGAGNKGQAFYPPPVHTPLSDTQRKRINEQQEGEEGLPRGWRPASQPGPRIPHPQPPPHLCRSPRAPRGGTAVTSLHKPWRLQACGGGKGPGAVHLVYGVRVIRALSTQMPGPDSLQCGGGRFVNVCFGWGGGESPITQIIYNTQTQLLAGWLHSQLCLGGAIIKWFNLIESSDVGVIYADLT